MKNSLLLIIALLPSLLALPSAAAAELPECAQQRFTVEIQPKTVEEFEVQTLRKQRRELYGILASRFFVESALGELARLKYRTAELLRPLRASQSEGKSDLFYDFLLSGGVGAAIDRAFFACGSTADHYAAILSTRLNKEDGERVAAWLTDPASEKLAIVMPSLSTRLEPAELQVSSRQAAEQARLEIIKACEAFGLSSTSCRAFPPLQPR